MSDDDVKQLSVLMERVIDQNRAVFEAAGARAKVENLPTRNDFHVLKRDVKTIWATVTDLIRNLERHKSMSAAWSEWTCVIVACVLIAGAIYWHLPRIIRCKGLWLQFSLCNVPLVDMCSHAGVVLTSGIRLGR